MYFYPRNCACIEVCVSLTLDLGYGLRCQRWAQCPWQVGIKLNTYLLQSTARERTITFTVHWNRSGLCAFGLRMQSNSIVHNRCPNNINLCILGFWPCTFSFAVLQFYFRCICDPDLRRRFQPRISKSNPIEPWTIMSVAFFCMLDLENGFLGPNTENSYQRDFMIFIVVCLV